MPDLNPADHPTGHVQRRPEAADVPVWARGTCCTCPYILAHLECHGQIECPNCHPTPVVAPAVVVRDARVHLRDDLARWAATTPREVT